MTRPRRVPRIDLAARVRQRSVAADEWRGDGHPVADDGEYWANLREAMLEEGDLDWLGQQTAEAPALVRDRASSSVGVAEASVQLAQRCAVPLIVDLSPEAQSLQAFVDGRLDGAQPSEPSESSEPSVDAPASVPPSPEAESLQAFVDERLASRAAAPAVAPHSERASASDLSDFATDLVRRAQSPDGPSSASVTADAVVTDGRPERRSPRRLPELLSTPDAPPGARRQSDTDPG